MKQSWIKYPAFLFFLVCGEKMGNVIHIEICKSEDKVGTWNIRIGDIEGSVNVYNADKEDITELILQEMESE